MANQQTTLADTNLRMMYMSESRASHVLRAAAGIDRRDTLACKHFFHDIERKTLANVAAEIGRLGVSDTHS